MFFKKCLVWLVIVVVGVEAENDFMPLLPKHENIKLHYVESIARDRFDNIYAASYTSSAVNKLLVTLDKNGNVIKRWGEYNRAQTGHDICADGKFKSVGGIGVDKINDFIYISDEIHDCIQKFDLNGNFITSWGTTGGLHGQMNKPRGIDVDSNGNVYVVDTGNNRIQKFTSSGSYIRSWGGAGNAPGRFNKPWKIAIDGSNVYITDASNFRVQVFDLNGIFLRMWGENLNYPSAITVDNNHNVYVTDGYVTLRKFDSLGNLLQTHRTKANRAETLIDAHSMIVGSDNKIYIGDKRVIQIYDSDLNQLDSWGEYGGGISEFDRPKDIVSDSNGNFYVVEERNCRIQKFKKNGDYILKWGKVGSGESEFSSPTAIDIDSSNNIYVVDSGNRRIQKFDSNGNFILQWSTYVAHNHQVNMPYGLSIDANDNIYVTEVRSSGSGEYVYILKYNKNGTLLDIFNTHVDGDYYDANIYDIDVDSNYIYISTSDSIIIKFNHQWEELTRWGAYGSNIGEFTYPKHIHIDYSGHVYVSDYYGLQEFDANGNFVYRWHYSDKKFTAPKGITTDMFGTILLVSSNDFRDVNRKKIEAGVMRLERNPDFDHDGVNNDQDVFPYDSSEWLDTDHDGIGNNADTDDDNDGISDSLEIANGLNPLNASDAEADFDHDGFSNAIEISIGTNIRNARSKPIWTPIIMGNLMMFIPAKP